MKKLSLYVFLGLLFCNVVNALPKCKGDDYNQWTNCKGTYTWASGEKYVGEFKNGKYHGQGTFTWADGNKYVGEWKDGNRHGQGTLTYTDGRVDKGIWKDGKLAEKAKKKKTSSSDDKLVLDSLIEEGLSKKDAKCILKETKPLVEKELWGEYIAAEKKGGKLNEHLAMDKLMSIGMSFTVGYSKCGVPLK